MSGVNITIVGVTGAVGQVVLNILEERNFPIGELRLLASNRSAGSVLSVMGKELIVGETTPDSFNNTDIVFFAAGGSTSQSLAPEAVKHGAIVVDKSSAWRMDPTVPLVIPEINSEDIRWHQGIISSPNCSTIVMLMALAPLHRVNPIKRIIVDTYQSASGAGGKGVVELMQQTQDALIQKATTHSIFPATLAFNAIPQVEEFGESEYTTEEIKMENEARKIMHMPDLPVSATCVRIPVPVSHSEAVHIEFANYMSPKEAREVLSEFPGVHVIDDSAAKSYPLASFATGKDDIFVGRIRPDKAFRNGLSIWSVGDNLRKGAALNAVQIAESLLANGFVDTNGNGR